MSNAVVRGLGWSTTSNLVLRMGNLLVSIVMARLLAPEQFGVFAVALTVWTVLSSLAEFGLTSDLVRSGDVERRIPTVSTLSLLISGSLTGAMYVAAEPLAVAFGSPESAGAIRLMSFTLLITGCGVAPAAVLLRGLRQKAMFGINLLSLVCSTSAMVGLALAGLGPAALAWGQIAGQTVTVVAQYAVTRLRPRFGFDRVVARDAASFSLPLAVANVLSWLLLGVDNLIVSRVMSPTDLGLYVLAFNLSSWPMSAVGTAIRVVALPAFAQLDGQPRRNEALVRVSGVLWAVALPLGFLLAALAGPLVALLYGDRWSGATAALVGLAAFGALRVVFDLLATFLVSAGSTRAVLGVQVWWMVVLVPGMYAAVSYGGLVGAGWMHVLVAVLAVLPAYLWCLHRLGVRWRAFLAAWVWPTLWGVPTAAACWWIGAHVGQPLLAIGLAGVVLLVLYAAPLYGWARRELRSLSGLAEADPDSVLPARRRHALAR